MRDGEPTLEAMENWTRARNNRGTTLPPSVRHEMEHAFAADFSGVRIFVSHAATLGGVQSFASGNDIHFAPGTYNPYSQNGLTTIRHELAHVVQQRGGRAAFAAELRRAMGDGSV